MKEHVRIIHADDVHSAETAFKLVLLRTGIFEVEPNFIKSSKDLNKLKTSKYPFDLKVGWPIDN